LNLHRNEKIQVSHPCITMHTSTSNRSSDLALNINLTKTVRSELSPHKIQQPWRAKFYLTQLKNSYGPRHNCREIRSTKVEWPPMVWRS